MLLCSYRSPLARFCIFAFCYDPVFAYPIYAVLFQQRGLGLLEISLLMMWWALSAGLFEVPSGALADHWSRRKPRVIAPLIKCMCFIVWCFAGGSFFLFALGFTFWGRGSSFVSGALEAMLYDTLSHAGRNHEYEKVCGRLRTCKHAACGIACITGGFIARRSMDWALLLSVVPLALATATALTMREPPVAHRLLEWPGCQN